MWESYGGMNSEPGFYLLFYALLCGNNQSL